MFRVKQYSKLVQQLGTSTRSVFIELCQPSSLVQQLGYVAQKSVQQLGT